MKMPRKSILQKIGTYLEKMQIDGAVASELGTAKGPPGIGGQPGLYYLHTDHLGTASFVTDDNSETTQFFLNLPFGETMLEQQTGVYDNPYKFNAKELDSEIGLYYYGARYYNPRVSVWLGVDPLAEKYPSLSPYVYTANNPVKYTDPDGREPMNFGPGDPWEKISIVTSVSGTAGLASGHSWIILTRKDGYQMTVSLWGNTGDKEFWVGKEKNNYDIASSRTLNITEAQAQKLAEFNKSDSNTDWNAVNTCAGYSAEAWNAVTGENLTPYNILGTGSPSTLADSIYQKNGNNSSNVPVPKPINLNSQQSIARSSGNSSNSNSSSGSSSSGSSTSSSSSGSSSGGSSIGGGSGSGNKSSQYDKKAVELFINGYKPKK